MVDEWKHGDDLLVEHLLHSKATGHVRDATCRWALYLKELKKWQAGKRVRPRHVSSAKEVCRDFSCKLSRRSSGQSSSDVEGAEATSSPSGAVPVPPRKKKAKAPPPPPPKLAATPPPPPKATTVPPPPPPKPTTSLRTVKPLKEYAVQDVVVDVVVQLE